MSGRSRDSLITDKLKLRHDRVFRCPEPLFRNVDTGDLTMIHGPARMAMRAIRHPRFNDPPAETLKPGRDGVLPHGHGK